MIAYAHHVKHGRQDDAHIAEIFAKVVIAWREEARPLLIQLAQDDGIELEPVELARLFYSFASWAANTLIDQYEQEQAA